MIKYYLIKPKQIIKKQRKIIDFHICAFDDDSLVIRLEQLGLNQGDYTFQEISKDKIKINHEKV